MSKRFLAREQPHQVRAFEFYCSLGEKRTYARVAAELKVTEATVKLWGKSFAWQKRLQQRELDIAREMASRTLSDEVNHREQNLKMVRMAQVKLAKAILEGDIKMSLGDLDRMIRLESFLRDGADSRQEIIVADLRNKSTEELREMVQQEVEVLKELRTSDDITTKT